MNARVGSWLLKLGKRMPGQVAGYCTWVSTVYLAYNACAGSWVSVPMVNTLAGIAGNCAYQGEYTWRMPGQVAGCSS